MALFIDRSVRGIYVLAALLFVARHGSSAEAYDLAVNVDYGEHYTVSESVVGYILTEPVLLFGPAHKVGRRNNVIGKALRPQMVLQGVPIVGSKAKTEALDGLKR